MSSTERQYENVDYATTDGLVSGKTLSKYCILSRDAQVHTNSLAADRSVEIQDDTPMTEARLALDLV